MPKTSRPSTTTTSDDLLPNPHPGEILQLEFMTPLGLSQNIVVRVVYIPPQRINELVRGRAAMTAETRLHLGRFFGLSEGFTVYLRRDGQNLLHISRSRRRKI